jgi:CHASE2 domain-containing sensor protein
MKISSEIKSFWTDCLLATVLVFVSMWGILQITQFNLFNAFDPIGQALADYKLTDYAFVNLREDPDVEQRIWIVNIGDQSRRGVAEQIRILSQAKPKVIGIDSFFDCRGLPRDTFYCPALKDTLGNLMLADAIREAGNVVLVTKLLQKDSTLGPDEYDSLEISDDIFSRNAHLGFANLNTSAAYQDDAKSCRSFAPYRLVNGKRELAFSVRMAMLYDSAKAERLLARSKPWEVINYRGNVLDMHGATNYPTMFFALDDEQVLREEFAPEMVKDQIVIMGYMGDDFEDATWEDKFYTPLNKKMAGKANPDMFGVVVHANALSMILNEDYVNEFTSFQQVAFAFLICFFNVALFSLINRRTPVWYDTITLMIQIGEILVLSFLMIILFAKYSFMMDITLTLAAVALVGSVYELYLNVFKKPLGNLISRIRLTKKRQEVLTPQP